MEVGLTSTGVLLDGVEVSFHRTLRLPDDGRDYPLPPTLGRFPVARIPTGPLPPR